MNLIASSGPRNCVNTQYAALSGAMLVLEILKHLPYMCNSLPYLQLWYYTVYKYNIKILSIDILQVSRAQILKKAADYITFMRRKNHGHQQDIDDLKKHNSVLEQQSKWLA